jgi:hypothetical protein
MKLNMQASKYLFGEFCSFFPCCGSDPGSVGSGPFRLVGSESKLVIFSDADATSDSDAVLTPEEDPAQMLMRFRLRIKPTCITFVKVMQLLLKSGKISSLFT